MKEATPFVFNDGGRAEAGYKGTTGDCVTRAIAIATERPYQEIYDLVNAYSKKEPVTKRRKKKSNARLGVKKPTTRKILADLGWEWVPTMAIGSGCQVHMVKEELPKGRIIVRLSAHIACVIDGEVHDIHDPSRGGTRCVYGYWKTRVQ